LKQLPSFESFLFILQLIRGLCSFNLYFIYIVIK
jgi:hypothetical protein